MGNEFCARCGKSSVQARLFDTIGREGVIKLCDECAKIEGYPIIRKPNTFQLKDSEKSYTVYERLTRAAGLQNKIPKDKIRITREENNLSKDVSLDDLRKPKKEIKELKAVNEPYPQLVDNFHWILRRARVLKKITRKQLAKAIGESEIAVKMAEDGNLPDDFPILIKKFETFFGINLRKDKEIFDNKVKKTAPARILSFDKKSIDNLTIGDLQEMKKRKKAEKVEEMKGIDKMIWGVEKKDEAEEDEKEIIKKEEGEVELEFD